MAGDDTAPNGSTPTRAQLESLLVSCSWPSEALWRSFELRVLGRDLIEPPSLEVGCGDGAFVELADLRIGEAIDRNPRAVARAQARRHVYGRVRRLDVRDLPPREGSFQTIFANSVLEHLPDLRAVLALTLDLLRPGGCLVATVPLADMNAHLAISARWYAAMRQRQLEHRNLWSVDEWQQTLEEIGFDEVMTRRYLDPRSCHLWDVIDLPACWGSGRYRLGPALRRLASVSLPSAVRVSARRGIVAYFERRLADASVICEEGCAALVIARKPVRQDGETRAP